MQAKVTASSKSVLKVLFTNHSFEEKERIRADNASKEDKRSKLGRGERSSKEERGGRGKGRRRGYLRTQRRRNVGETQTVIYSEGLRTDELTELCTYPMTAVRHGQGRGRM